MDIETIGLLLLGVAGGFLNGLIGSGAGVLIVPVMVILGYSNVDHASSFAVAISCWTALLFVIPHYIRTSRDQEWISGIALFLGGAATAQFGVAFTQNADPYVVRLMLSFLAFLCLDIMNRYERRRVSTSTHMDGAWVDPKRFLLMFFVLAGITGFAGGMVGSAGGLFLLPLLLYFTGMRIRAAVYSCLFMMAGSSLSALYGQSVYGDIDFNLGIPLAAGAVVGGFFGSLSLNLFSERSIRNVGKLFLSEVGLFMLLWSFFV
tara:strand:- start:320 stop:1105 length:786 start_codon:yes stop_codon:yes gene_type:complete